MAPHEIFEAIETGDADRVQALAADDPSVAKQRDADGVSAILQARYHGRRDLADVLLRGAPELDVFEAAAVGDVARLRELLDEDSSLVDAYAPDGFHPLALAAFFGERDAVELLLARGADARQVARHAHLKVAPLHSAAAGDHTAIARLLLDAGADVDATQPGGFTALHGAAQHGNRELVELLLERGADARRRTDEGRSAADFAREAGHAELAAQLEAA